MRETIRYCFTDDKYCTGVQVVEEIVVMELGVTFLNNKA